MSIYALKRLNLSKHLIVSAFEGCLILQNELLVENFSREIFSAEASHENFSREIFFWEGFP